MIYSEKTEKERMHSGIKHAGRQSPGAKATRLCLRIFQFQFFWLS